MNYLAIREAVNLLVEEDLGIRDEKKADIVLCQLILRTPVMIMGLADVAMYAKDLLDYTPHGVLNQVLTSAHILIVEEHIIT